MLTVSEVRLTTRIGHLYKSCTTCISVPTSTYLPPCLQSRVVTPTYVYNVIVNFVMATLVINMINKVFAWKIFVYRYFILFYHVWLDALICVFDSLFVEEDNELVNIMVWRIRAEHQ